MVQILERAQNISIQHKCFHKYNGIKVSLNKYYTMTFMTVTAYIHSALFQKYSVEATSTYQDSSYIVGEYFSQDGK